VTPRVPFLFFVPWSSVEWRAEDQLEQPREIIFE